MAVTIPTVEEIHDKIREYLYGTLGIDAFTDWIEERDDALRIERKLSGGSFGIELSDTLTTPDELLAGIELMDTEMVCSGSFRTEEMFRQDLESILKGQSCNAFWGPIGDKIIAEKYPAWCAQREKDIEKLNCWYDRPWWRKLFG